MGGSGGAKHRPDAQSGGSTPLTWVHSNYVGLVLDLRLTRDCTERAVFGVYVYLVGAHGGGAMGESGGAKH